MQFILSNIQESNVKNTKTHDLLTGLGDFMQEFLMSCKHHKIYYEPVAEYSLEKIGRHIKFVVTDLETNDKISGYAVLNKK